MPFMGYSFTGFPGLPWGNRPAQSGPGYGYPGLPTPASGGASFGFPALPWGNNASKGKAGVVAPRNVWLPKGAEPRWTRWPQGVEAYSSQSAANPRTLSALGSHPPDYGTLGPNVINPLWGRPGFTYSSAKPRARIGPAAKLAPGTGATGVPQSRQSGFVPAAYAPMQFIDTNQFDYLPANDPTYDIGGSDATFGTVPRTINVGVDGREIVGTYKAHDFAVPSRFFKEGRSGGYWQDQSFGPEYRYLLPAQQVARYNLYTDIALARQLSPNAYFLGYQTQPAVASQIANGLGQGRPLGY